MRPLVAIVMGSDSDWERMRPAAEELEGFGLGYRVEVASAHRSPDVVADLARRAEEQGLRVFIAGAGLAAHLAGVIAAHTTLPVIGVPLAAGALSGVDALYATVQMPPGVPVATVGIDAARNAGLLAAQILATADPDLRARLARQKAGLAEAVARKNRSLQASLAGGDKGAVGGD